MAGGAPSYRTVVLQDDSLRSLQGFTQVPNVVLKHSAISFGAKVAYGVLLSYAWSDDFCFPAQDRLAKDLNCSVRQVQRLLNELKDQSFITWKQQGLNKPNIYYLLPMTRWNRPDPNQNPDTTNLSSPDTTDGSPQEATKTSHKEDSTKNTHTVVNRAGNDHRNPVRDRPSAGEKPAVISDQGLRSKYQLSDDQIGRVHWLVEKQVDTLGSVERNHAHYVKRAAEAVRDGNDHVLDRLLGEFKQVTTTIPVGSRPAYFHRMYTEAFEKKPAEATPPPVRASTSTDRRRGPEPVRDLFRPPEQQEVDDSRTRMIADAERRGFPIPDYIRNADTPAVNRWWAALTEGPQTA